MLDLKYVKRVWAQYLKAGYRVQIPTLRILVESVPRLIDRIERLDVENKLWKEQYASLDHEFKLIKKKLYRRDKKLREWKEREAKCPNHWTFEKTIEELRKLVKERSDAAQHFFQEIHGGAQLMKGPGK